MTLAKKIMFGYQNIIVEINFPENNLFSWFYGGAKLFAVDLL